MIRNLGSYIVDELRLRFLKNHLSGFHEKLRLLDLGCGEKPFKHLYESGFEQLVGIDMPSSPHSKTEVDVFSSGTQLPFKTSTFDVVLSSEVLEHVAEPEEFLLEVSRVLKTGGALILTTPFLVPEHETPIDYFRYTRFGLSHLLGKAGFKVVEPEPFGEVFGVFLSFFVQIQMKFWSLVSKFLHFRLLATVYNPFILLFVLFPQWFYVSIITLIRKSQKGERVYKNLSYSTKGFGVVARK